MTLILRQHSVGPTGRSGFDGWTPILALLNDGERRIQQIIDWTGGQGDKPIIGWFIGEGGLVENISAATDIRGVKGDKGDTGSAANPGSVTEAELAEGAVTNTKLTDVPSMTLKGRVNDGVGSPADLTAGQARSIINSTGWRVLEEIKLPSNVAVIDINIPEDVSVIKLQGVIYFPAASTIQAASFGALASFDGTNFLTASQYVRTVLAQNNTTLSPTQAVSDWAWFSPGHHYSHYPITFDILFYPGSDTTRCTFQGHSTSVYWNAAVYYFQALYGGNIIPSGRVKKLRLCDVFSALVGAGTTIIVMGY